MTLRCVYKRSSHRVLWGWPNLAITLPLKRLPYRETSRLGGVDGIASGRHQQVQET
jgi:hypothetical protein